MVGLTKVLALQSGAKLSDAGEVWDLVRPDRDSLNRLKRVSLRSKSWFSVLSLSERRFLDAVMMTVDKIRSVLLLRVLAPLVRKLLRAIGGDVGNGALALMGDGAYMMMKSVAEKIVGIAQRWGNKSACEWLEGPGFIRYLIVMSLPRNRNPPMFTIPNY